MNDIEFLELENVLQQYGEDIVARYRRKLERAKKNATGMLSDTMRSYLRRDGSVYAVYIELQDYWRYLEYGTGKQGPRQRERKAPPQLAILEWIKAKPVIPYKGKDGKIPTQRQLAFLIARKIARDGTRPFYFMRESIEEYRGDIMDKCRKAIAQDIVNWIKTML